MYFLREGFIYFALSMKGRGECRALTAPAASRASWKKHTSIVTTGSAGITRHSPRNGFNRYGVLSLVRRAFWPPSPALSSRRLDTSVGVPGPHVFSVRKISTFVNVPPASTASRPAFVTIANAPLVGRDAHRCRAIRVFRKEQYCRRALRQNNPPGKSPLHAAPETFGLRRERGFRISRQRKIVISLSGQILGSRGSLCIDLHVLPFLSFCFSVSLPSLPSPTLAWRLLSATALTRTRRIYPIRPMMPTTSPRH